MLKTTAMKNRYIIIFLLVTMTPVWGFQFGVKAGGNLSFLTMSKSQDNWKNDLSWQFGLSSSFPISRFWHLTPQIHLSNFRSQLAGRFEDNSLSWNLSRTQIQLPLLFKWQPLARKEGWQPVLMLGPQYILNIASKCTFSFGGDKEESDVAEKFESNNFGFVWGIGLEIPISKGSQTCLSLELCYNHNFKNQIPINVYEIGEFKQNALSLMAGFSFL